MAKSLNKRFFARHAKSSAMFISLIIHAVLIGIGLSIVVVTITEKQDQAFVTQKVSWPQMGQRKHRVPVNIRKKKLPKPKIRNPDIFDNELKTVEIKPSDMTGVMGGWDFLDSYGGLDGLDLDLDINFFGIIGGGTHVVFIMDCSLSMWGDKERIMRREAVRIIQELPRGTHFGVIFFGGPAWPAGLDPDLNDWVQTAGDWQSFRPKDWNNLPKVKYKKVSSLNALSIIRKIKTTPLIFGTVYDCPIYMALSMDPIPDTIFFMTDGESSTERGIDSLRKMVDQLTAAGKKVPVMHTVGFGISHNNQLMEMAALMRGQCKFMTTWEYIRKYGRDKSRPARLDSGFDVEEKVESVPAEQYPVEFSLR